MSAASAKASATVARGTHDAGRRWLGTWLFAIVLALTLVQMKLFMRNEDA